MINNNNLGLLLLFGWVVFTTLPLFQAFAQIVWASSGNDLFFYCSLLFIVFVPPSSSMLIG